MVTAVDDSAVENESAFSEESAATPGPNEGPTELRGAFPGVTVWSEKGSPYIVEDDLAVELDGTLVIGPNTQVLFDGNDYVRVQGRIAVVGARGQMVDDGEGGLMENDEGLVVIASNGATPTRNDWQGFDILEDAPGGRIDFDKYEYRVGHLFHRVRIQHANSALEFHRVSGFTSRVVAILNSEISEIHRNPVYTIDADSIDWVLVRDSVFSDASPSTGSSAAGLVHIEGGWRIAVLDSTFTRSAGQGLHFSDNETDVIRCTVTENADGGLYIGSGTVRETLVGVDIASDNSFIGDPSGSAYMFSVESDHTQNDVDATGCFWGATATAELDAAGAYPQNMSFIHDYYDDVNLARVDYRDHRPSALPMVTIDGPVFRSKHPLGTELTFTATADDPEDGPLDPSQIEWRSDAGDLLETGSTFVTSILQVGIQRIHAYAYDSDGQHMDLYTDVEIVAP